MIVELCRQQGLPEPDFRSEKGRFDVIFYKDPYTEEHLREMGLSERQVKAVVRVKERGEIANKEYQEVYKISSRTASRDLADLVDRRIFEQLGTTGRGTSYALMTPERRQRSHKDAIKTP